MIVLLGMFLVVFCAAWLNFGVPIVLAFLMGQSVPDPVSAFAVVAISFGFIGGIHKVMGRRAGPLILLILIVLVGIFLAIAASSFDAAQDPPRETLLYTGGMVGVAGVLYVILASTFLKAYECASCRQMRRIMLRSPKPCPGAKGGKGHKIPKLICPSCQKTSHLCKVCSRSHGCLVCRRDLSDEPKCPGPLDKISQCVGSVGHESQRRICPTHYPERCPDCQNLREQMGKGREVSDAATCSHCGEKAHYNHPAEGDLGPLYRCYDPKCPVHAHLVCLEGTEGKRMCFESRCKYKLIKVPKEGHFYGPGGSFTLSV